MVYPNDNITKNTKINIITMDIANRADIQIGEVIHHQDQSMFPVNFNTKNTTNNTPGSPIPLDVPFSILFFFIKLRNFFDSKKFFSKN